MSVEHYSRAQAVLDTGPASGCYPSDTNEWNSGDERRLVYRFLASRLPFLRLES